MSSHRILRPTSHREVKLSAIQTIGLIVAGTTMLAGTFAEFLPVANAAPTTTTVVRDNFDRSVSGGWGSSTSGAAYTATANPNKQSVGSGEARMTLAPGSTVQASLAKVSVRDVATEIEVSPTGVPGAGNGVYVGPMVRVGSSGAYRLSGRVAAGGELKVSLERVQADATVEVLSTSAAVAAVKAGQPIKLSLEAVGENPVALKASATVAGASKTLSYKDAVGRRISGPGSVAVWSYLSRSSSATALSFASLRVDQVSEAPTPAPTPTPTSPAPTTPPTGAATDEEVGSVSVGKAAYPVPSGAVFVSPSGSDQGQGTQASPYRTLTRAVNAARAGSTVVVRGGSYHESVMMGRDKPLTVQAYPNEAVWLDGSSEVTGFTPSGSTWVKTGWTTNFDSSPTFSRGAPDGTAVGWQFLNPKYPMAAHPDQVWIDGKVQTQVGKLSQVGPGTFFVDNGAQRLYVGSDPSGRTVKASTIQLGLTVLSKNTVIRGIGIRRYAPSVPDMGAVRLFGADGSTLENVVITESSTNGLTLGLATTNATVHLNKVTSSRNGLMGIGVNRANGLLVERSLIEDNNTERFNMAPSAGGFKLSNSLNVTIRGNRFSNNYGTGLWFDNSCVGVIVSDNDFVGNASNGLTVELAARVKVVNNLVQDNTAGGVLVLDSNKVDLWNNSITGSKLPVRISDGPRIATTPDPAHASGQSPEATWVTKDINVRNNVIGDVLVSTTGENWCGLLCMLDDRKVATARQMNATMDGDLYFRRQAAAPSLTVRWANGSTGAKNYSKLSDFVTDTDQERHGGEVLGTSFVDDRGVLRSGGSYAGVGVAVPSDIASISGLRSGLLTVGAVR